LIGIGQAVRESRARLEIAPVIEIAHDHRHDHCVAERGLRARVAGLYLTGRRAAIAADGIAIIALLVAKQ
jgi:hypothetical protein